MPGPLSSPTKYFSRKDLDAILYLQKLEEDAKEMEKSHEYADAMKTYKEIILGWKCIIAERPIPSMKKDNLKLMPVSEVGPLTSVILEKYYGGRIKELDEVRRKNHETKKDEESPKGN